MDSCRCERLLHALVAETNECEQSGMSFKFSPEVMGAKDEEQELARTCGREALLTTSLGPELPTRGLVFTEKTVHAAPPLLVSDDHDSQIACEVFECLLPCWGGLRGIA